MLAIQLRWSAQLMENMILLHGAWNVAMYQVALSPAFHAFPGLHHGTPDITSLHKPSSFISPDIAAVRLSQFRSLASFGMDWHSSIIVDTSIFTTVRLARGKNLVVCTFSRGPICYGAQLLRFRPLSKGQAVTEQISHLSIPA